MGLFSRQVRLGSTLNTTRKSVNLEPRCRVGVSEGKALRENIRGKGGVLVAGQRGQTSPGGWWRIKNLIRHEG